MSTSLSTWTATLALALGALLAAPGASAEPNSRSKKTIVLVHGAFADGSSWDKVVPLLQAKGYEVVAVHEPFTSFADDVAATQRAIERQAGEVVLVGHSYGGAVITEAGNIDKVVGLVYVAAFGPDTGESINDLGKGKPPPPWITALQVDAGGFGWLPAETVAKQFAQDLSAPEGRALAVKQGPIAVKSFDAHIQHAAWHEKPTAYVLATHDHMIDPAAQAEMARRMHATVTEVSSSHVAMVSQPRAVAAAILRAATVDPPATAMK